MRLLQYLKTEEREVWDWFASARAQREHLDAVRLRLLRATYRLDRDSQPALYRYAEQAAEVLGQNVPITLYQAQQSPQGLNAALMWMPAEAHIILQGPLEERLSERELLAVFGHELAHLVLWSIDDGEYYVLERVLEALANDPQAEPSHLRTRQLFELCVEVFCDRGAMIAATELEAAVSALVKISTGVSAVNARSFLDQADEALATDVSGSEGETHPETVMRARCLRLWSEGSNPDEEGIQRMIEGKPTLARLDLLEQVRLTGLTQSFVERLLTAEWIRSELVLAHARLYFDDGRLPDLDDANASPVLSLQDADPQIADYFCYILLDFVTSDSELREPALAHALLIAREIDAERRFLDIVQKELGLRKRQIESLQANAVNIIGDAARSRE
jgi:hypothetical protein